ncbi:MAG: hypothetical protein M0R40_00830 [Firmicutes bacterium]|nr:hypothetical protein [Bacillota bacterium]
MRKVYYPAGGGKDRKKNIKYILLAIVLLVAIFFLSFIVTYNIIAPPKNKNAELDGLGMDIPADAFKSDLPEDVIELQQLVDALREENEYLNSQVEKYKALAEARSGNIPLGSPPPVQNDTAPKQTTPKPNDSGAPTTGTETQKPSATKPKEPDTTTQKPETPSTTKPNENTTPTENKNQSDTKPQQPDAPPEKKQDAPNSLPDIPDDGIIDGI